MITHKKKSEQSLRIHFYLFLSQKKNANAHRKKIFFASKQKREREICWRKGFIYVHISIFVFSYHNAIFFLSTQQNNINLK